MTIIEEGVELVLDFLTDAISWLFDWFIGFFSDIFTGRSLSSVGSSIINIFINGSFSFDLKSVFELLFGIAFMFFFIRTIIHIVRG